MNVVFDFGAVLFTWRPLEIVAHCFPTRAATPPEAGHLAHALFGHADWQQFDAGTLTVAEVVERTSARLDLDHRVLTELVESIGERLLPMADSVALLAQLHAAQTPLYFLSNMPVPYARELEQRHGFLSCFTGGIFSGDVQHIKPDPAIYQLLQTRYALEPAHTVFIDDLLGNVQAARAQSWHGIHFESVPQVHEELQALGICQIGS